MVENNSHMGGVDLRDMLLLMYQVRHWSTKYYMHIVFYCIGVVVVNGWLFYRRHMHHKRVPQKKHMPLISFQSAIAASLYQAGKYLQELHIRVVGHPQAPQLNPAKKGNHHLCQTQWRMSDWINVVTFLFMKRNSSVVYCVKLGTHT